MTSADDVHKLIPCVTERQGSTYRYTDDAPAAGKWIGYFNPSSNTNGQYNADGTCDDNDPTAAANMVPLTTNKTELKNVINAFQAAGSTAGQLGTAWAWYTLSPKWNSIWPSSAAGQYADLTTLGPTGAPKLRKIAVLMTDGDYNKEYTGGNPNSETQAKALCTAMKTAKIEVYTVGFQVSNDAKTLLKGCATDNSHFYDASTGKSLKQAFRDIALKISNLRIKD